MDIYLEEFFCGGEYESVIYIHLPGTDLWFTDTAYDGGHIEETGFTKKFWEEVAWGEILLTKLGEV